MISGHATAPATHKFLTNFSSLQRSKNKLSGLTISAAGFGTYRTTISNSSHRQALCHAVENGVNLIDTSANYGDGGSEELVGSVIEALINKGQIERESVIVVTKGGYLQGQNFAISQQRKAELRPFPDLVEDGQGLEHCIHPEFLADQISRSLTRLELETIDIFLLHNPEYFLGWAKKADWNLAEARAEYYRRIQLAFEHLEAEVANGRIMRYGISSNSFPNEPDSYDFTSLEKVYEIANGIDSNHHFQAIQFPMNLLETGGATAVNQSNGRTLLDFAHKKGLISLVNRPLNAVVGNNLIRLAQPPQVPGSADPDVAAAWIDKLVIEEARLQRAVFSIDLPFRTKQEFAATTGAGRLLEQRWEGFGTFSNWQNVRQGYMEPRSKFAVQFLNNRPELPPEAAEWIASYTDTLKQTLDSISAVYRAQEAGMLATIRANVETADSAWRGSKTISQTALRALRSTSGITSTLIGMRQIDYVDDVLAEFNRPVTVKNRTANWHHLQEQLSDQ